MKRPTLIRTLICAAALLGAATAARSSPLDFWFQRGPFPNSDRLSALSFMNGTFVAAGPNGAIGTSTDGLSWALRRPGTLGYLGVSFEICDFAYGSGTIVAVGVREYCPYPISWFCSPIPAPVILVSKDAVSWMSPNVPTNLVGALSGITYGDGVFVAIGVCNAGLGWSAGSLRSVDGGSTWAWHLIPGELLPADYNDWDVTYGNGMFVAVGPRSQILTSPDGSIWTARESGISARLRSITYAKDLFVVVGEEGAVLTSVNGVNWNIATEIPAAVFHDVAFGGGTFVAVGNGLVMRSEDGTNWMSEFGNGFSGIAFGNNMFLAFHNLDLPGPPLIMSSPDGSGWTELHSGGQPLLYRLAYGNETFVAVANDTTFGGASLVTSKDGGVSWSTRNAGSPWLNDVAYGGSKFVAVGGFTILVSDDGLSWSKQNSETNVALGGVTYGDGKFVAVGAYYEPSDGRLRTAVLISSDSVLWMSHSPGTTNNVHSVAYGNERFVAVGESSLLTSPDGISWSRPNSGTNMLFSGVTYGNGRFVAVGGYYEPSDGRLLGPAVLTSTDSVLWMSHIPSTSNYLHSVAYGNGRFVAVDDYSNSVLTSPDGISWSMQNSAANTRLYRVTYGNGTFIAVGEGGLIIQSGSFIPGEISTPRRSGGAAIELTATGEIGRTYRLQATSALAPANWIDLFPFTLATPTTNLVDATVTNSPSRFYRLASPQTNP